MIVWAALSSLLYTISPAVLDQQKTQSALFCGCMQCLEACREELCKELGLTTEDVELSMGMSGDFEQAVSSSLTSILLQVKRLIPEKSAPTSKHVKDESSSYRLRCIHLFFYYS